MKTKKTLNADLERKRPIFFSLGLIVSLGLVLAAFSWTSPVHDAVVLTSENINPDLDDIVIPRTEAEKPKPAPHPITFDNLVPELTDGVDEIDPDVFNSEINVGDAIDFSAIVLTRPDEPEAEPVHEFVQQMPEFPGGMSALMSFVAKSVKYPTLAQETGTQGRVIVRFIVNSDGSISQASVVRPVDPQLDQEAIRVVLAMPRWKPGFQNGKPVRVVYHIPINFLLQ